jgi:hypothetical protein
VTRQTKQIGVILALVAMVSFGAWPFWKYLYIRSANAALREQAQALAERNPQVQLALEIAMQDDVLTQDEAEAIVKAAREKAAEE